MSRFKPFVASGLATITMLFCACATHPIDTHYGFKVDAPDEVRFGKDRDHCAEQSTLQGYPDTGGVPEQSIRAGQIRRCLASLDWKTFSTH